MTVWASSVCIAKSIRYDEYLQIMCAKYYELRCMFKKIQLVNVGAFAW